MGSNNYGYIPFPVPPPSYSSTVPGLNQNWKSAHYQSQSPSKQSNSGLQKTTKLSSNQDSSYTSPDSKRSLSNSTINLQSSQNQESIPPPPNSSDMISLPPPPPPPPYLPSSSSMSAGIPSTYYMPNAHQAYHSSRYSAGGLTYPAHSIMYSPVSEYSSNSHYYSPPPPPPPISNSGRIAHYQNTSPQGYSRNNYYKNKNDNEMDSPRGYYKRRNDNESENQRKNNKKRKKPLSQNIPQRKDWSVEEAKRAIDVEKDYNKRNRSQSLIIKFPDEDLNRDIVSAFHPGIDNVHFQQPSTPRFCFVTLKENVNAEDVIRRLNKIRFGQGFLCVEYKKDREDEMNIGPEDIDPLTLYVGNLAQDVIKEDMVKIYPKHKRVDIGYAKKMKYTRYAFVSFRCIDDAIEAFKKTHATQLYNKSLIVRFRRLHGTVGMPGEPKPQLPQKSDSLTNLNNREEMPDSNSNQPDEPYRAPWELVDVSTWDSSRSIKREPLDSFSDEDLLDEQKSEVNSNPEPIVPPEENFPQPKKIKEECIKSEVLENTNIKETISIRTDLNLTTEENKKTSNRSERRPESIKREPEEKMSSYKQLLLLNSAVKTPPPLKVKKEINDSPPEFNSSLISDFKDDLEETKVTIKAEPLLEDGTSNDGDKDNSSGDEFDFNNILSKLEQKKNKNKRLKDVLL